MVARKAFYNYTPEAVMAADLTKIEDRHLRQYVALHIYTSFIRESPDSIPNPPYARCLIEMLRRMPSAQREEVLGGAPAEENLAAAGLFVIGTMSEAERQVMWRVALKQDARRDRPGMEVIPSNLIYQFVQRAIARAPEGIFRASGTEYPLYSEKKNGFTASMEMRPNENLPARLLPNYGDILASMNEKLDQLGDIAVDVMDIILSRYMKAPGETVNLHTDEILRARGLRPKMKNGYSAGYRLEDRQKIGGVMEAMDNLWITVGEMTVYVKGRKMPQRFREKSRLMMITGVTEQVSILGDAAFPLLWQVRLGEVFNSLLSSEFATQYALLSTKTLQYDPYHQRWEKRLSRYFHPLWRIRQANENFSSPIRVSTLLEAVGMPVNRKNPQRTRERFEQALDRLAQDSVTGGWNYAIEDADEQTAEQRGWLAQWLNWRVHVLPSPDIEAAYRARTSRESPPLPIAAGSPSATLNNPDGKDVLRARKNHGLTQAELAKALGVSRSLIAQIERGNRAVTDDFAAAFLAWRLG